MPKFLVRFARWRWSQQVYALALGFFTASTIWCAFFSLPLCILFNVLNLIVFFTGGLLNKITLQDLQDHGQ
jgi:integral membrane sensor domain MASE1